MNEKPKKRKRSRTESIDRILEQCLEGEDADKLLESLNPSERDWLYEELRNLKRDRSITEAQSLKIDFYRPPPTIVQFIEDDYYLGKTLKPSEENVGIYPAWRAILIKDFNLESRIHNAVITGSLGIGKCWCPGTCILMSDGSIRKVEGMRVGDDVMGDDSTPRTVTSITSGKGEMYEIYPAKGEPFTVNADHVLVLKSTNSDEITEVSVKDFLQWPRDKKHKACLYRVGVDWAESELSIDPYIFGLWLGDGHSSQTVLTSMDQELVSAWLAYGKSLGLSHTVLTAGKGSKASAYQLSARDAYGAVQRGGNELRNRLISLGLFHATPVSGDEKFIPQCYLVNSRENRLQLLAGLIDTDGCKAGGGEGTYEITFKIKRLADQTRFLAQSLGYFARTHIKIVNSTAYFRTHVSGAHDVPVRLARKKSKQKPSRVRLSNLTGTAVCYDNSKTKFAVIPCGEGDYYGFTLTGDGRCLLKDFTVTHNTYCAVAILLYRITVTCLLRNPQNFFGLSRGSNIIYNILSVTREAVRQTAFGDAINFMGASAYFMEELRFNPEMEYSKSIVPFRNNVYLTAGSKGWHVLGRNVLGVFLDEGNVRLEADPDQQAYALYDNVRRRITNRFQKIEGYLPAISLIASSAQDESSFTEHVIRDIEKAASPHTQAVYRQAVYNIKRHTLTLGRRWFKVAHGLKNQEPSLLSGWYLENGTPIEEDGPHEESPKGARIELVPELYWPDFRRNPRRSLQDVSGISTGGTHRLFSTMVDIERAIELSEAEGIVNPAKGKVRLIPLSLEDQLNIWDYLDHPKFLTRVQSRVQPKRHPNALRYAHLDLATSTKAGLSICHLVGAKRVDGVILDGRPFDEYRLIVEYDFILTITAGQVKSISFTKICQFFFWLRDMCGYRFGMVTADQFQSKLPLEMLETAGMKTDLLSLDRDKTVYLAWRTGFEDLRIRLYRQEEMMEEAEQLMEGDKKFDHPDRNPGSGEIGSKDTTDSCGGAYWNAITSDERTSLLTDATPSIHTHGSLTPGTPEAPPLDLPMPAKTHRTVKEYDV